MKDPLMPLLALWMLSLTHLSPLKPNLWWRTHLEKTQRTHPTLLSFLQRTTRLPMQPNHHILFLMLLMQTHHVPRNHLSRRMMQGSRFQTTSRSSSITHGLPSSPHSLLERVQRNRSSFQISMHLSWLSMSVWSNVDSWNGLLYQAWFS